MFLCQTEIDVNYYVKLNSTIQKKLITSPRQLFLQRDSDQTFAASFPVQKLELVGFPRQCLCLQANTDIIARQHVVYCIINHRVNPPQSTGNILVATTHQLALTA